MFMKHLEPASLVQVSMADEGGAPNELCNEGYHWERLIIKPPQRNSEWQAVKHHYNQLGNLFCDTTITTGKDTTRDLAW